MKTWLSALLLLVVFPVTVLGGLTRSTLSFRAAETQGFVTTYAKLKGIVEFSKRNPTNGLAPSPIADKLLGTANSPVLRAALQTKIRDIAQSHGVQIAQASDVSTNSADNLVERVGIQVDMSGSPDAMFQVLKDIENAEPWLFVNQFEARSSDQEAVTEVSPPVLYVSMQVWGAVEAAQEKTSP